MNERIINEGDHWHPRWVVYDETMRIQLFSSSDFQQSVRFLEQEVRRERLECAGGKCED